MKSAARLIALTGLLAGPVLAGPAEDALVQNAELRRTLVAQEERIGRLEAQLQNQGLLNLLNQVEALKAEVARLRGSQEEQNHKLDSADKRMKDLFADLDGRVKELASRPVVPPPEAVRLQVAQSLTPPPTPVVAVDSEAEARAYEAAHALVKAARYKEAVGAFQTFLRQFPEGPLAANAHYWTGFSLFGLGDFKSAATAYQKMLKEFPNSPKVPDALLSLARTQAQMNETEAAKATLDTLIGRYPQTKAADNGKKLLATLK